MKNAKAFVGVPDKKYPTMFSAALSTVQRPSPCPHTDKKEN
jgi:hypothetical protein